MMRLRRLGLLVAVLPLLSPDPVFAYLDPASGSLLLQIILGGVAGLALILKLYWRKILRFLRISKEPERSE